MFPNGPSTSIISPNSCAIWESSTTALARPATCSGSVNGIDNSSRALTVACTPSSRPRCRWTGSAPAASRRCSSRAMQRARTAAVTLPSPKRSRMCQTIWRIIIAPAFSTRSGRSVMRRAMVAPSLRCSQSAEPIRWLTIFPPRGPSVSASRRASVSKPRCIGSRHSGPNRIDGVGMAQPFRAPSVMPLTK